MKTKNFIVIRFVLLLIVASALVGQAAANSLEEGGSITDKTMIAWVKLANLTQRGCGVISLWDNSAPGKPHDECFDAIVFGERVEQRWMAGSEWWNRTQDETTQGTYPSETADSETLVGIAIVWEGDPVTGDATMTIYRDGVLYAGPYTQGKIWTYPTDGDIAILLGMRYSGHDGIMGAFNGVIEEARIYNQALDAQTIAELAPNQPSDPQPLGLWDFEDGTATDAMGVFPEGELHGNAYIADGQLFLDGQNNSYVEIRPAGPAFRNITIENTDSQYEITLDDNNSTLFTSQETYADEVIARALRIIETDGQITIKQGEYLIQNAVLLKSNLTIRGVDTTAVIKRINGGHVIMGNGVKNVTIKKLKVQSSMDYEIFGSGIFLINGASNNIIDSCVVREVAGHGIMINDISSENNIISNNIIADCNGNAGIGLMYKAGNATITKNKVYRTKTHGIIVSGGASNCTITHNYVESSGYYRPANAPLSEYFCHGIAIDGGMLENRGSNHLIQGNTVINSGRAGIEVADGQDNVVIRDNYVHTTGLKCGDASDQYGIYFGGALETGVNGKIINNSVYNAKKEGIKIGSGNISIGRTNDVLVDSNLVSNARENGIRAECVGNAVISNNEVVNSAFNGVKLEGRSGFTAQNISILNNEISGSARYGVDLSYAEAVNVTDNNICNNTLGIINLGQELTDLTNSGNQCSSTAIDFSPIRNEINVYPNPFTNMLTVNGKKDITNLKIYQIDGSLVYSKEFDSQSTIKLSTENFESGIYILSIQAVDGHSRMKIMRK